MSKIIRCPEDLFDIDLSGKIIVITGGYGGIGLTTASQLINQKATVIMAGRNSEKGSAVAEKVGCTFMHVDTSDMDSVRIFCSEFISQHQRLDVLMCNAAIMAPGEPDKTAASKRTKEGWEIQMATNYLGHALMVHL